MGLSVTGREFAKTDSQAEESSQESGIQRVLRVLATYDEQIFLGIILLISTYMLVVSTLTYDYRTRIFPQVVTAPTVILSFLLLVRPYLPDQVQNVLEREGGGLESLTEEAEEVMDEAIDQEGGEAAATASIGADRAEYDSTLDKLRVTIPPKVATSLMTLVFLVISLFIGIFWAGPVLVMSYYLWFGKNLVYGVITSIVLMAFVYGVGSLLNLLDLLMGSPLPAI